MEQEPMTVEELNEYLKKSEIDTYYNDTIKVGERKCLTTKRKVKRKVKSKLSRKTRKVNIKK